MQYFMADTVTDNIESEDLYAPDSLPAEYFWLLDDICKELSRSFYDNRENDDPVWDGSVFRDFCIFMPEEKLAKFKEKCKAITGVQYRTFYKTDTQGIAEESGKAAFCLSAEIQEIALPRFLEQYIYRCFDRKFEVGAFKKHKSTVEKILRARPAQFRTPESNTPSLSIQDQITIKNEIDRIKQKLGFYPYRRENSHLTPPGEYSIALDDVERLLVMAPGHGELTSMKAILLSVLGQTYESLAFAENAYQNNSSSPEISISYTAVLCENKKYNQALDIISKVKNNNHKHPQISLLRGICLDQLERYEEAIQEYNTTINQDKTRIAAYCNLAIVYYKTNQMKKCENTLQTALAIFPDSIPVKEMLLIVTARKGDHDRVTEIFLSVDKRLVPETQATFFKAIEEFIKGNFNNAVEIVTIAIEQKNATNPDRKKEISELYEKLANLFEVQYGKDHNPNHFKHAKEYYQKALNFIPSNPTALFKLAFFRFSDQELKNSKEHIYKICDLKLHLEINFTRPDTLFTHLSNELKKHGIANYITPLFWGLDKYPDSLQISVYLMKEYLDQNNITGAEKLAESACKIANSVPVGQLDAAFFVFFYDLAECLIRINRMSSNPERQEDILSLLDACCSENVAKLDNDQRLEALRCRGAYSREVGFKNNNENLLQTAARDYEELLIHIFRHKERERWLSLNDDLADIYGKLWNITGDAAYLERKAIHLNDIYEEISIEENRNQFLETLFDLAHCYLEISDQRKDKDYLEKSEQAFQYRHDLIDKDAESDLYLESCYFWGLVCYRLSDIEFNQELHDRATDCFEKATKSPGEKYAFVSWEKLGVIYHSDGLKARDTKLIKKAIKTCQTAISLAGENVIEKAKILIEIGAAYHNLGHIGSTLSQFTKAIESYDAAMDMLRHDADTTWSKRLNAVCIRNKGQSLLNIYDLGGRTEETPLNEAFACFDSAITLADQAGYTELVQEVETIRTKVKKELKGETGGGASG